VRSALILIGFFSMNVVAAADYLRTGRPEATVCKGIVVEYCYTVVVDAVQDRRGNLFEFASRFETVDEYTGSRCHIQKRWTDRLRGQQFLHREGNGKFSTIKWESVSFPCKRI
jgi:hypothetical protein